MLFNFSGLCSRQLFVPAVSLLALLCVLLQPCSATCFQVTEIDLSEQVQGSGDKQGNSQTDTQQGDTQSELDDKWKLTDEDRMSNEELRKELFGEDEEGESDSQDSESNDETTDDEDEPGQGSEKTIAKKQSIESYLSNINSLTIETYSPPPSGSGVDKPTRISPAVRMSAPRSAATATIYFQTPDIYHNPLYFEDQSVERLGVHAGQQQPFESARKFLGDVFELPTELHALPPNSRIYRHNLRYSRSQLIK